MAPGPSAALLPEPQRHQDHKDIFKISGVLFPLRISAFLCASAVKCADNLFTAEPQRNAEKKFELRHNLKSFRVLCVFVVKPGEARS